jgi:hypothetical protein
LHPEQRQNQKEVHIQASFGQAFPLLPGKHLPSLGTMGYQESLAYDL